MVLLPLASHVQMDDNCPNSGNPLLLFEHGHLTSLETLGHNSYRKVAHNTSGDLIFSAKRVKLILFQAYKIFRANTLFPQRMREAQEILGLTGVTLVKMHG
jgi:hypothetical protein